MSRQQLYISGKAVDMPSEEIKIKVASNIFSDASKIMTAHSYSITLPRTMTNDSIFALAYVAGADTGGKTTHRYLKASLYMDGVPLFEDGQAVLNKVDDNGYSLNLFWGLLGIFNKIKEENLALCDMPASAYWNESLSQWIYLSVYDDQLPQYTSGMTQAIFDFLDSDSQDLARKTPWLLPSVRAVDIISTINNVYGIGFTFSDRASSIISSLYHPLTTRRAMAKGEKCIINGVVQMRNMGSSKYEPCLLTPTYDTDHLPNIQWAPLAFPDHPTNFNHSATNGYIANSCASIEFGNSYAKVCAMNANCDIKITKVRVFGALPYPAVLYFPSLNNRRISSVYVPGSLQPHTYDVEWTDDFSVKAGDEIFHIADEWEEPESTFKSGILNVQFTIEEATAVQVTRPWEYVRNYPNVGVINYLSEILAHIGGCIVGSVAKPNTLHITTYNEIINTTPNNTDMLGLKSIEMALDDLAQKNIYQHKENNDVGTKSRAEGVIYCNDTTLEIEKVAFDSKFKVPIRGNVPLWDVEWNEDDSEYNAKWNNAGDYISGLQEGYIADLGQSFDYVVSAYLSEYEQVVTHPKVIEVIVRLGIFELLNLDMSKPVYINQLASSFLIVELSTEKGDQYKLKLVKI